MAPTQTPMDNLESELMHNTRKCLVDVVLKGIAQTRVSAAEELDAMHMSRHIPKHLAMDKAANMVSLLNTKLLQDSESQLLHDFHLFRISLPDLTSGSHFVK